MSGTVEMPAGVESGEAFGRVIGVQFDTFCRAIMRGDGVRATPEYFRVITGEMHPLGNFGVVASDCDLDVIDDLADQLCEPGVPCAVVFTSEASEAGCSRLESRGFGLGETMPAMGIDLERVMRVELPEGCACMEVGPEDDGAWADAFSAGYELPRPVGGLFGPKAASRSSLADAVHYYAIVRDGAMIATSILLLEGGLAGVYGVSTLPAHRGRGLGACATAHALSEGRRLGCRTGILQSSAMGESVYRRLGFSSFGALPIYVHIPGQ